MKFYYKDKLVRTSNHNYTHAVMNGDKCEGCRTSFKKALAIKTQKLNSINTEYKDMLRAIKAIEEGKSFYWSRFRGKEYKHELTGDKKHYEKSLHYYADKYIKVERDWIVVQLECRD